MGQTQAHHLVDLLTTMSIAGIPTQQRREIVGSIAHLMRNGALSWRPVSVEAEKGRVTIEAQLAVHMVRFEFHYSPVEV